MAVIMGVFAWGGRIAARVLRGAADVVEGLVGLIDAGLDASGDPEAASWADPGEDAVDPFERFRASAAARSAADSFVGRTGAAPGQPSWPEAARETERAGDDRPLADGLSEEDLEEVEADSVSDEEFADDEDSEDEGLGDDDFAAEEEEEDSDEAENGVGAGDDGEDVEIDDAFEVDEEPELEAAKEESLAPTSAGEREIAPRPATAVAAPDGLDSAPPAIPAAEGERGEGSRAEAPGTRAGTSANSFGEAFRSRGSLAPAPDRGRFESIEPESVPRPGTRDRIAAALDAARSTFESARARRAFGGASIAPLAGERLFATGEDSAKGKKKRASDARSTKPAKKSKKKDEAKKSESEKRGEKARKPKAGKVGKVGKLAAASPGEKSKKPKDSEREKPSGPTRKSGRKK